MPSTSTCAAIALALALGLAGARASAQERVVGELRAGGGYDSNPSLAADPGNRRDPSSSMGRPAPPSTEDGVARVGGHLLGQIGGSPAVSARFDLDGRVYGSGDVLFYERLVLEGSARIDDLLARCRLEGARLDLTLSDDSAWSGAVACGAALRLPHGFWIAGEGLGGVRAFDAGQLDGIGGGELSVGWSMDALAVELGLTALRRESDEDRARRTELAPWIAVRLSTEHVGGQLAYRFVQRIFDADSRSGGEHTGRLEVYGMPLPWIGAYAELELGYAEGGAQALAYERVQITGGLRLALDWRSTVTPAPEPLTQGPATLEDGGWVRFELALPGAERVAVVGDFNGWDPERGLLERRGERFVGRFQLGSGRHEYSLIVDGEPRRPPGAPRYVSDDLGGENAVLVVP